MKLDDMALQASEENNISSSSSLGLGLGLGLQMAELGPTDLLLLGNGWSIPVHRSAAEL